MSYEGITKKIGKQAIVGGKNQGGMEVTWEDGTTDSIADEQVVSLLAVLNNEIIACRRKPKPPSTTPRVVM